MWQQVKENDETKRPVASFTRATPAQKLNKYPKCGQPSTVLGKVDIIPFTSKVKGTLFSAWGILISDFAYPTAQLGSQLLHLVRPARTWPIPQDVKLGLNDFYILRQIQNWSIKRLHITSRQINLGHQFPTNWSLMSGSWKVRRGKISRGRAWSANKIKSLFKAASRTMVGW